MKDLFNIKDKVAVITGGYGILGRSMAEYLCAQGVVVLILGRNEEKGNALIHELKAQGGIAYFIKSDVMNQDILAENAKFIKEKLGRLDILVNAAGGNMKGATIAPNQNFLDLDANDFRKVMDLNLMGTVLPTMAFAPIMIEKKKGSIINISSMSAFRPLTRVVGYSASKAAISNFTQYMATELATKFGNGLRVNAMAPGFFLTNQNRDLLTNPDGSLTARGKKIIEQTPFGRFGSPDELNGTLHYLASDASAFVTGTVAVVDGGFNAFCL